MADQQVADKAPTKIVSIGKPERGDFPMMKTLGTEDETKIDKGAQGAAAKADDKNTTLTDAEKLAAEEKAKATSKQTYPPKIDDAAVKEYLKGLGIDYTGAEDLKKKLAPKESPAELTEEEKLAKAKAKEERLFDLHKKRGGTIEQWAELKKLSETDVAILGREKLRLDLKTAGFSPERSDAVIKKMHIELSDEEIADMSDEEQAEIKKERDFAAKKLANRGLFIQKNAKGYFDSLAEEATDIDADTARKQQYASNVEAAFTSYQRKQEIDLGKVDDVQIPPVEFEIPETVLTEAKTFLTSLESQILNKDGTWNLEALLPHVVNSFSKIHASKTAYLEGETRGATKALANFSSKPPNLGGNNGAGPGENGKIVKAGKPERGQFPTKNN